MCKTDIVCRLLCTLADTDHHGLREETSVPKRQTLFTIGMLYKDQCQFLNLDCFSAS